MRSVMPPSILLAIVSLILMPSAVSAAEVAVVPPQSEGVDSATLEIVEATLIAKLPDLGWTVTDTDLVSSEASTRCAGGCSESSEIVALGEALGADIVLVTELVENGDEVVARLYAFDVTTGLSEQAAATTTASGILAKVVGLMKLVIGDAPQPAEPALPVEPVVPPPVEPVVAPDPPAVDPEPVEPAPPGPAPLPPGSEPPEDTEHPEPPDAEDPDEDEEESEKPEKPFDQSGRLNIAISSTMYAMMMTFTIMFAVDKDIDWYWYPPAMLLAGGGALAASLLITWKLRVTQGDAAMFQSCLGWGTGNGTMIALALGNLEARPILVGTIIGGGVGLAGGILAGALFDPSLGDAALVSAAASWGSAYATMIAGMVMPTKWESYVIAALVGMDVALAAGIVASIFVEVEPRMVGIVSLAGTLGGLVGATVGLPFVIKDSGPSVKDLRGYTGMIFGFTTLGLTLGILIPAAITKKKRDSGKVSTMPFLLAHDESGWRPGMPGLMPVPPIEGVGVPITGAQIGLAGGVF